VIKSKILNPLLGRNQKFNIINWYGPMYIIDVTMTPSNVILVDYNRLNHRVKLLWAISGHFGIFGGWHLYSNVIVHYLEKWSPYSHSCWTNFHPFLTPLLNVMHCPCLTMMHGCCMLDDKGQLSSNDDAMT
jgi:hypothetical protein